MLSTGVDDLSLSVNKLAIIVGGAECVWHDLDHAGVLLGVRPRTVIVCNDMIAEYPYACIAVTLHTPKLQPSKRHGKGWLAERAEHSYPAPTQVWANRLDRHLGVTNVTEDWGGSAGLFGVAVALRLGCDRVLLCGVPMRAEAGHFVRKTPWDQCKSYVKHWERRVGLKPVVRSMGGWTAEQFGGPTEEWLG
jgi:hypothetical protein